MSFLTLGKNIDEVPLVGHIFNKIYLLLPIESSLSINEVEDNVLFLDTRKALMNIACSPQINDIVKYSVLVLERINHLDSHIILKQRSRESLSSILIILRLLADLLKVAWDHKEPQHCHHATESIVKTHNGSIHTHITTKSDLGSGCSNWVGFASAIDYHSVPPTDLETSSMIKAIALLSRLKSVNNLTKELAKLNGKSVNQLYLYDDISTKPFIDQIDISCDSILRFLAAANPDDYFDFTVSKLNALKHNIANDGEFAPYLELIASIYFNEHYLLEYLKHLRVIMATIKKPTYRQLVLSFFIKAMTSWIHARPQEYLNCVKVDSAVSMESEALFDDLINLTDSPLGSRLPNQSNSKSFKASYRFLAFLLSLYPKAFEQHMALLKGTLATEKRVMKKLTPSFNSNKKQKLLSSVHKSLEQELSRDSGENIVILESLDFFVAIASVASSIFPYDPENIVVKYSLTNYDLVTRVLVPINKQSSSPLIYNPSEMESSMLTDLRLEYFSSICVLCSDSFIPQLVQILRDENASLETLYLTSSILRIFSTTPSMDNSDQSLLASLLPYLRQVMNRMSHIIKSTTYLDDNISISSSISDEVHRVGTDFKTASITSNGSSTSTLTNNHTSSVNNNHSLQGTPLSSPINTNASLDTSSKQTSSASTVSNLLPPRGEKLKESTKNFFRQHHSFSNSSHLSSSQRQELLSQAQQYSNNNPFSTNSSAVVDNDDLRSYDSKDNKTPYYSREILVNALSIFNKNPHSFLHTFANPDLSITEKLEILARDSDDTIETLIIALNDSNSRLSLEIKNFMLNFISFTQISCETDDVIASFSGIILFIKNIARFISRSLGAEKVKKDTLEMFAKMAEYRLLLEDQLPCTALKEELKEKETVFYQEIGLSIEQALLVCLCVPDLDTYGLVLRFFRALDIGLSKNESAVNFLKLYNREFYTSMANDNILKTGNVALQKVIRKNLLKISTPTDAVKAIWLGVFNEWYILAKSNYSELTSQELSNFRNFAGFLAAVSGILVDFDTDPEIKKEFEQKVDIFIKQQLAMLKEDNLVTRENAKEILALELNSKSYPRVIKLTKPIIESFARKANELNESDLTVMELLVTLLKAVLDYGETLVIFSVSIDILTCVDLLARTLDSIQKIDSHVLKLKIRLSTLFQKLEVNNDKLLIKYSYKLRNKFFRYVYNWFDQAITYESAWRLENSSTPSVLESKSFFSSGNLQPTLSKDYDFLYIDIATESVKALSFLLDSLVLEAPQVLNEKELKSSKANIFSIYFNTFLKALERFSNADKFPVSVRHKVSTISEFIVQCLTNLLKSNVDVGLSYALPVGSYTNLPIRTSFLKVFVSIVESYSKPSSEADMGVKKGIVIDMIKFIIDHPKVLSAIGRACPPSEAANLAACAQRIGNTINQTAVIVSILIEEEIMYGSNYSDILRRNSFASRSLSSFGRAKGHDYLLSTLRPILTEIRDSELELEVEKIDETNLEAERNLNNFMHYLKKLVHVIIKSVEFFPVEFRYVCKTISESVASKFPNYRLIAVGSFIFLRFFCPAIVSPESEKIVDIPNRQIQRKFLLLAKVLQNMANGSISTLRWPLLKKRESELNELNEKISSFLNEITVLEHDVKFEFKKVREMQDNDYNFFHTFTYENWETIRNEYLKHCTTLKEIEISRKIAEATSYFLKVADQPTVVFGYEIPSTISPEKNSELYEFMSKYSFEDLNSIIECPFIHHSTSQDGVQLLVFSYSEYTKIESLDLDLAIYRIFQVASKVWDQKYKFIIDCTGNNGQTIFPRRALTLMSNISPEEMKNNCLGIYYYNVSSSLYKYLNHMFRNNEIMSNSLTENYFFPSAKDDKKTVINLGLSTSSMRCYNDLRVKFTDISLYQEDQHRFVPITLKIGNEYLQIGQTTPQRLKVLNNMKEIYLNDVYQLSEIEKVEATETTTIPNELTIFFKDGTTVILAGPKFLEIMRLLYFTKKRSMRLPESGSFLKENSETSDYDILGQLFNVIFLGLTSSSEEVRSISYNLLATSQKHFQLDLGKTLEQFPAVFFPRDNNAFVVSISEKLAQALPQITGEFIGAFFKVYKDTITPRQRLSAILYVSPWISNIYDYVYESDGENGADFAAEIIRNFLSISKLDPVFLSAFNLSIWAKLCLEDRICPILVNEIVLTAIDREAEGSDWRSTIVLLTSTPTVKLCGHVIYRLREISRIPFPDTNGSYTIESHSYWVEITVLVQISVSLFFDSLEFTEMFLPDIFYIVTALVDVGPIDLRVAIQQLLLNVLQSFLTKPGLSDQSKSSIRLIVEQFTSHRARILFGLNRDNSDSFTSEVSKFSTRVSTVESLVASLLEIIDIVSSGEEKSIWIGGWKKYVLNAVWKNDPVLRGRTLILLGVLSKDGIDDDMVTKVLQMVYEISAEDLNNPKFSYLAICTIFSLGKISEGLSPNSNFFVPLWWLSIVITHSNHIAIYQGGLQFMNNCLLSMHAKNSFGNGEVINTILKGKDKFDELLTNIESLDEIVISNENFDQVLLHFASKGLQLTHVRALSLETLGTFFKVRNLSEIERHRLHPATEFDRSHLVYLLFLSIFLKQTELEKLLEDSGLVDDWIELGEDTFIPQSLLDFCLSDSDASILALYQLSRFFTYGEPNDKAKYRFLALMVNIGIQNSGILLKFYHEFRNCMRSIIANTNSSTLVSREIFKVSSIASVTSEYRNVSKFASMMDGLLAKYNVIGIKNYKFPSKALLQRLISGDELKNRPNIIKGFIKRICETTHPGQKS
ncbi:hypothetical protein WICMUC_003629 [Wickerhamomyces mucosus]|uniref:Ras-GAP domain-containing protein n=1 Tax=Wickerhamomyces mucosus TaxID=1378264 RepID=A0A9P8PJX4_9ASCO|nr:hypothetical protein WICMUC_003629 [Wickerhamomyces mucosus]